MLKECERVLRDTGRALLGSPRTWGLSSQAARLSADLPSRLEDALARTPERRCLADEQPVFLFSAGWRSGSTLLQRMLMEHNEDLLIWGEPFARSNIHDGLLNQFRAFTRQWPPDSFFFSKMEVNKIADTWTANLYPDVDYLFHAHRSFYHRLFADPAARAGRKNWGFKEVRLTIQHATYFRTLFPNCKIVLLYRHPHNAYLSYRESGMTWARTWPGRYVSTPLAFGRSWAEITRGYIEGHAKVDALLIRYEDLDDPAHVARLESYLGWRIPRSSEMRRIGRDDDSLSTARSPNRKALPRIDRILLNLATRNILRNAGYARK
ncbi:MAG: sulfotransferase [Steroidobacteraceae bacterium]